jgi:hypothetical protein
MRRLPVKSIAITAVAGLAAAASAQGVTLTFSADTTQADIGDTIGWTVSAEFTGFPDSTAYYGGFSGPEPTFGQFIASDAGLGTAGNFVNMMGGEGVPPMANGASVEMVNIFNSALLGTNDPANPLMIFSFDVVAGAAGDLSYTGEGVHTVFPDDGIFTLGEEVPGMSVSDTVTIVPAPGAFALLGLGGLAAARRRR